MAGSIELPPMFATGWLAFSEPLRTLQIAAGSIAIRPR
jgi:hypothetical protein